MVLLNYLVVLGWVGYLVVFDPIPPCVGQLKSALPLVLNWCLTYICFFLFVFL